MRDTEAPTRHGVDILARKWGPEHEMSTVLVENVNYSIQSNLWPPFTQFHL